MKGKPRLTVFMPVYNGETFIGEAIESILRQTYTDFVFVIINDGSSDSTESIISRFKDKRIILINHDTNIGIPKTRNHGLDLAEGDYLALMDSDDIASPKRLESQIKYLDQNQDVGVCGTWYRKISGASQSETRFPINHAEIMFKLLFDNAFGQNTVMLRRSIIEIHGLRYDINFPYSEDYDFWVRCSKHMRLANLPESHVVYRYHPSNSSSRFSEQMVQCADRVRRFHVENFGIYPSETELQLHLDLLHFCFEGGFDRLNKAGEWLSALGKSVISKTGLPENLVYRELSRYWYGACGRAAGSSFSIWRLFRSYPMGKQALWEWQSKLLIRSLLNKGI